MPIAGKSKTDRNDAMHRLWLVVLSGGSGDVRGALKKMGFVRLSARPRHHAQNEYALEAFKKTSPHRWQRSKQNSARARP